MSSSSIPLDDILDALEAPRAGPGIGYLERLFHRFNERVPFENASKILRNARVADPAGKPRTPEIFWEEHLSSGTGGTCFARVAAFEALIAGLGFEVRPVLGRVERDFDHAALLVTLDAQTWICDVGFPLPAVLLDRSCRTETPLASLLLSRTNRGFRVELEGGVPLGPRSLEIFETPIDSEIFLEHWLGTFQPDSKFLSGVVAQKTLPARKVSFSRGEIRVDDLHSRTSIPLLGSRAGAVAAEFGMDPEILQEAFRIAGNPEPDGRAARIEAFLEVISPAEDAFRAIASPAGYGRLMAGVADVSDLRQEKDRWHVRLSPAGALPEKTATIEEEIVLAPADRAVSVRRGGESSFYRADTREGRTYLVRGALLSGAREDLLRNDSLRGRLAGALALDLLAWARLSGRSPSE